MSDISILLKDSERSWIQIGEGAEYRNIELPNTFYTYGYPSWTEMAYLWKTVASPVSPGPILFG